MEASKKTELNLIEQLIREKGGIRLDIGCGGAKQPNFVGMDIRPLEGVDVVHDIEVFPWPLPDECVFTSIMSHVYEHIDPSLSIELLNEIWRVTKWNGQLAIAMPYGVSFGFVQDPTHKNAANQATWQYFDPRFPLYGIYKPKPWQIARGFPVWQVNGNMEVLLEKKRET